MSETTHIKPRLEVCLWRFVNVLARERIQEPGAERLFMLVFTLSPSIMQMRQSTSLGVYAGALTIPHDAVVAALRPAGNCGRTVLGGPRRGVVPAVITLRLFLSELYGRQAGLYA